MSEQTVNPIIPPVGASNETLIGDLSSYFRWNEETRQYEINERVDPGISTESWAECPSPVYDRLANPNRRPTLGEIVRALNNQYLREQRKQRQYDEFRQQAYSALEIIGERLIQESEDRGWCDEFDRIISEVNESLPGPFALPEREKEYEVSWTETVMVRIDRSITVRARNVDEAMQTAPEEIDSISNSEVVDAVRYGSWEVDEYADHDYEVQEV